MTMAYLFVGELGRVDTHDNKPILKKKNRWKERM
jgi:hypothetical protein